MEYYTSDENRGYLSLLMQDKYKEMWKKIQIQELEDRKVYFEKYPVKHIVTLYEKQLPQELQCKI